MYCFCCCCCCGGGGGGGGGCGGGSCINLRGATGSNGTADAADSSLFARRVFDNTRQNYCGCTQTSRAHSRSRLLTAVLLTDRTGELDLSILPAGKMVA